MNLISCSFDCKWQRDGYCYLNEIKKPQNSVNSSCIYYEQVNNDDDFTNFLSDEEPLLY
ncbi:MAG: hypothetical protein IJO86_01670 [Oscillospiraceae bacterium]|nr:hypothetical protein [Oscillospiraceae bacterium]